MATCYYNTPDGVLEQ